MRRTRSPTFPRRLPWWRLGSGRPRASTSSRSATGLSMAGRYMTASGHRPGRDRESRAIRFPRTPASAEQPRTHPGAVDGSTLGVEALRNGKVVRNRTVGVMKGGIKAGNLKQFRRYGFHGLSYEHIAGRLREVAP